MPSTKGFTRCNYPPEILWRNPEETGRAAIMKNEMAFVLLDEKISFIRFPPHTLQNFWQVIT
jgi:hypothetical protein